MPLDNGHFGYVYNPFSLEQMGVCLSNVGNETCTNRDGDMDAYLECLSIPGRERSTCSHLEPIIQHFQASGISAMAVLARCRSNYAQKVWDIGAHALFNDEISMDLVDFPNYRLHTARAHAVEWARSRVGSSDLEHCLTNVKVPSEFSSTCLDIYLRDAQSNVGLNYVTVGTRRETYFAYKLGRDSERPASPDACSLFTGPAKHAESNSTKTRFAACLMGTDLVDVDCTLPMMAWTGNQHSRVPMGTVHREQTLSREKREMIAHDMYASALRRVENAFSAYENSAKTDAIDVLFFSAEGDALHQMIDC
eukprot:2337617-Rhodomonas_salina.1